MEPLPLRDIHLPLPIGFWPLANGWWWVIGILVALLLVTAYLLYRRNRPTALKQALASLDEILGNRSLPVESQNQSISLLLKQLAVTTYGREQVAPLMGPAWFTWVEEKIEKNPLSNQMKRFLALGAYSRTSDVIVDSAAFKVEVREIFISVGKPLSIRELLTTKITSLKAFLSDIPKKIRR